LPSVPTNLHSTSVTSDSVSLAWNASDPGANCSVQYIVFRNGAQAGQTPNTSFTVTGLAAGTTFSFTVAAINTFGTSAQSAAIQAWPTGGGAPPTAAELLAKVANCRQISNGLFKTDSDTSATIPVCQANGAVWWKSDMDIDCDGVRTSQCNENTDPAFQPDTS